MKNQQPIHQIQIEDLSQKKEQKVDDQFICFCQNIVMNPLECDTCQKWMCQSCIDQWMIRGNQTCPNCRQHFRRTPKLHHFLKNTLDSYLFQCRKCIEAQKPDAEKEMTHSQFSEHILKKCPVLFLQCPFLCDPQRVFSQQELNNHLLNGNCPNDFQLCPRGCGYEILNKEIILNTHNCLQHLKNIIAEKNLEIELLKIDNQQLKQNQNLPQNFQEQPKIAQQDQIQEIYEDQEDILKFNPFKVDFIKLDRQLKEKQKNGQLQFCQDQIMNDIRQFDFQNKRKISECYNKHQLQRFKLGDHQEEKICNICGKYKNIQNSDVYWGCDQEGCSLFICNGCKKP